MQENFEIRPLTPELADSACEVLSCLSGREAVSREELSDIIASGYKGAVAAFLGEELAGVLCYSILGGDTINIDEIAVSPACRGRGGASALMSFILKTDGIVRFELEVRSKNTAARALYEKYGFKVDFVRKNYYSNPTDDALLMSRGKI
jgi:ribosomal-protein-alanine N-acetyltransferase